MEAELFPCFSLSEFYSLGNSLIKLLLFQARLEVSQRKCHLCWGACQAAVWPSPQQQKSSASLAGAGHRASVVSHLAICYEPAANGVAFDVWSTDLSCFHRTVVCAGAPQEGSLHILLWSKAQSPRAHSSQEMEMLSSPELQILLSCGVWGEQGWEVSTARGSCWSSLHPHDNIQVHAVTEVSWTLLLKVSPWNSPFCADGQGEHSSPSPALMSALSSPPCSPQCPPQQLSQHSPSSAPQCAQQHKLHIFHHAGLALGCLWAGQGWWRQHLPACRGSGAACGLSNHAGISASLQLPLKNAAPSFLLP